METGEGEPVLLIPGAFSTYRIWNRMIPELSKKFRVLAIDYIGTGDSDKPTAGFDFSVMAQADVIAEMIQSLNLRKVGLIGVSYGSVIALNITSRYPQLVERVACIEGGALIIPEHLHHNTMANFMGFPLIGDIILAALKSGLFDRMAAKSIMGTAWEQMSEVEKEEIAEIVASNLRTSSRSAWYGIYRSITSPIDFTETLKNSSIPVLYIYGEQSRYREMAKRNIDIIRTVLPNVNIVSFDSGIHDLELQYPDRVVGAILQSWKYELYLSAN
ncbi:MAG: alpha/beta hydrolase [Deltaproteobacteria bacterium]|nr:alpha/beta hydrolase [Deltaproteobacteria bacterium]